MDYEGNTRIEYILDQILGFIYRPNHIKVPFGVVYSKEDQGNNPNMYAQTIKAYLARGAIQRPEDVYPNPQCGYGILNIFTLFQNII